MTGFQPFLSGWLPRLLKSMADLAVLSYLLWVMKQESVTPSVVLGHTYWETILENETFSIDIFVG